MITIICRVPDDREHLGIMSLDIGGDKREFHISAQSDPRLEITDPQGGLYRLIKIVDTPADPVAIKAYGPKILFFEHDCTPNMDGMVLHGGDPDVDGRLFPTEGSLRMSNEDLETLVGLIKNEIDVRLVIREEKVHLAERIFPHKVSENPAPRVEPEEKSYPLATLAAFLWASSQEGEMNVAQSPKEETPVAEGEEKDFLGEGAQKQVGEIADEVPGSEKGGQKEETGDTPIIFPEESPDQQPAEEGDKEGQEGGSEPEMEKEPEPEPEAEKEPEPGGGSSAEE